MMKMLLFVYAVFRWMVDIMELWGRRDELGNEGIEALVGWKELKNSDELKRVCFVIVSRIWIFSGVGKEGKRKEGEKKGKRLFVVKCGCGLALTGLLFLLLLLLLLLVVMMLFLSMVLL